MSLTVGDNEPSDTSCCCIAAACGCVCVFTCNMDWHVSISTAMAIVAHMQPSQMRLTGSLLYHCVYVCSMCNVACSLQFASWPEVYGCKMVLTVLARLNWLSSDLHGCI